MPHPFYILDVFADRVYAGNQLAVVTHADDLPTETMQAIAAETNYSETTFVNAEPEADGGYRVRLFTPARELAFAGHPLVGTAWAIRRFMEPGASGPVRLNLQLGQVPVRFESGTDGETLWFRAPPVTLGATCPREVMAAALGIDPDDIDPATPVQQAAAGTAAMIVPLRSLDALKRSRLNLDAYAPLLAQGFPPLTYLFTRETHDAASDLCVRFFFEAHGVREDPATGNGAAFLGAYLLEHGHADVDLRIEQGHEVRRPSRVRLRARKVNGAPEIEVGGQAVLTVRGELV